MRDRWHCRALRGAAKTRLEHNETGGAVVLRAFFRHLAVSFTVYLVVYWAALLVIASFSWSFSYLHLHLL